MVLHRAFIPYDQVDLIDVLGKLSFRPMEPVEFSSMSIGICSVECAVCPPGSSKDAMPEDTTHKTILPSLRSRG
jgi:hypothetical protein